MIPRRCKKCRAEVPTTPSGHLRAHRCEHGAWCTVPYALRRHGEVGNCPLCYSNRLAAAGEQLPLRMR